MDMFTITGVLVLLGVVCVSAFYQFSALIWTGLIGATLIILGFLDFLPLTLLIIVGIIYVLAAAFANLSKLRQRYVVRPALNRLRQQIPSISKTERDAIEAGNTWWEKDLFCGKPQWRKLFAIPRPVLSKEEQDFIDNQVEHLCAKLNDWEIIHKNHDMPQDVWDYLKQEIFFGLVIPKQYGGRGFSALAHSSIVTKIATRSMSVAVNTMVPNSLGPGELLLHYGTDEQKKYYLPRLANGTEIPCFGLTSADAASDAAAMPDSGVVCRGQYNGQETLGIRLNWNKRYITLAPVATLLGLAFYLTDPDKLLGGDNDIGITLCLIPTSHPGVEIGNRHYPLSLTFMNGPTSGKDVFIPLDWIIGGPTMAGQGWRMLMECLSVGRSISLPALSTACGKIVYRNTGAYARIRRQFNASISAFEGIEEALGNIAGYMYLLESCRIMTAGAVDLNLKPSIVSAIAKYHMTEMARAITAHAMDIHAGHMIQIGPRNFLANIHSAIPISITVEGANILTRNLIIFGQGAIRCHPFLLKEIELITNPNVNIADLDKTLMSHVGYFIGNLIRNILYGLSGGKLIATTVKNRKIRPYQRQLTRMSAALALLSDSSLILLGGSLKRRERISARLGDIMSQLYLASSVLKYFNDNDSPETDVDYVCWSLQSCLQKIQIAIDELLRNFPQRFVGKLLSWIIFPYGNAYAYPADKLNKRIVAAMLEQSAFRDRLTNYTFISKQSDDLGKRLETALMQIGAIDVLWKKVQTAIKNGVLPQARDARNRIRAAQEKNVISAGEAQQLNEFEMLREEIIKVNEFSFDLNTVIS